MDRRTLLKAWGSSLLCSSVATGCQSSAPLLTQTGTQTETQTASQAPRRLESFGLQLSTVTPLMLADFEATLALVAAIGYREVEFSAMGFLGRPVERVIDLLSQNELHAPVGRITPELPDGFFALPRGDARKVYLERSQPKYFLTNVAHSLKSAVAMGQRSLILPALGPSNFKTRAQVDANIKLMNDAGALCAEQGVQFGYHNHNWEFAPVDGVIPYDLMLEQTNADTVTFQLDAYWVTKGGGDLSDYLSRFAGRFSSCHLKDIDEAGDFADVGSGQIDFPRFTREALAQGARHFFVERDNPPEPEASIRRSFAYVEAMTF